MLMRFGQGKELENAVDKEGMTMKHKMKDLHMQLGDFNAAILIG